MSFALLLVLPPIAFFVLLAFFIALSRFTDKIAYKNPNNPCGKTKAYACGEDVKEHRIRPDYSQFFPFAFFFTVMHVIALIVAASPELVKGTLAVAILFIIVAYLSILIIFRRDND